MPALTDRQTAVLLAIHRFILQEEYPPTVRELRTLLGIASLRGVVSHLRALERKGVLVRKPRDGRAMRITAAGKAVVYALRPSGGREATDRQDWLSLDGAPVLHSGCEGGMEKQQSAPTLEGWDRSRVQRGAGQHVERGGEPAVRASRAQQSVGSAP